ncbi:hypothetical protein JYP51_01890 [Ponticoccus gilvus]|nr:hypothetical protein [Enemella evansiae]
MTGPSLAPISLDGFVAFFAVLAIIMAVLFWALRRKQTAARKQFFSQFEESELRMSPYEIGLVYKVTGRTEETVSAVPIWRGKAPIANGKEMEMAPDRLIPFDETRFFS